MSFLSTLVKPLAYVSLPVFALHTLSKSSPIARYYVRLALYLSTLGVCSAWGVVCAVGMSLVGRKLDVFFVVARTFYMIASRALDIRLVVEGEEHLATKPAVLIGNHQSMLDILYLGRIFPRRAAIIAKKELQWSPLLGQFMTLSGVVWIDRGNNAKAVRSLSAAGETMKAQRMALWLFPEGTRSMREHHDLLPFKKGAFHIAVQAGVPIVPVVCENYWRLYRKNVFESGTLKVRGDSDSSVLPPIPTEGLTVADIPDLAARVHDAMVAALREISGPPSPIPSDKPDEAPRDTLSAQASSALPVEPEPAQPSESVQQIPSRSESRASTQASEDNNSSPATSRRSGSDNGTETEEDDGMVLVGRPK
ncbi:1-acylglycerol-3-phosphate O [Rhodofomes roseus]|uniref:1-acyl-sn-glycerol-3-phosphate acyltransferase n=1 Tax=Rhodofomes roseus TaxID=34475 RepID=A0ABQ8KYH4_9APHY|nr:1-acylglycerol-3-phosphate O [Rhodofomes roseus]KAH9844350.1 1-acylglycerol-3-phosphate O [Rhodofomes roseus]